MIVVVKPNLNLTPKIKSIQRQRFPYQSIISIKKELKGNAQFLFLCSPQKSSVNVCLMKIIKKHYHKKSNRVFL